MIICRFDITICDIKATTVRIGMRSHKMATVYIETTIPSYLAARPSRDLVTAAHQQITHEW